MKLLNLFGLVSLFALTSVSTQAMNDRDKAILNLKQPIALEEVQQYALGQWQSIAIELRPTEDRSGSGTIAPTYLTREFNFISKDKFIGTITMYADNYGEFPMMAFEFKGSLTWGEQHPIANGAWNIDYVLDEGFAITPLSNQAADILNQLPSEGVEAFRANVKQDILKKPFPLFNIAKNQIVADYDLIYFNHGMLFMGAKHVDGTPFDKAENRPHQLQIPLVRVY